MNNEIDSEQLESMELPPMNFSTVNFPTIKSPHNKDLNPDFRRARTLNPVNIKQYQSKNYMHDENLTKFEKNLLTKTFKEKP